MPPLGGLKCLLFRRGEVIRHGRGLAEHDVSDGLTQCNPFRATDTFQVTVLQSPIAFPERMGGFVIDDSPVLKEPIAGALEPGQAAGFPARCS